MPKILTHPLVTPLAMLAMLIFTAIYTSHVYHIEERIYAKHN